MVCKITVFEAAVRQLYCQPELSQELEFFCSVCAVVAVVGVCGGLLMLCVPLPGYRPFFRELSRLPDCSMLEEPLMAVDPPMAVDSPMAVLTYKDKMSSGLMLVVGVGELLVSVIVFVALLDAHPLLDKLLFAWTLPLAVAVVANFFLGLAVIKKLMKGHSEAREWLAGMWVDDKWVAGHVTRAAMIAMCSVSRIELMHALRAAGMPVPDRHVNFLRFQGHHQYLLADLPHLLVAIAMLLIGFDAEQGLTGEHSKAVGILGIAKTVVCISFGLLRKKIGRDATLLGTLPSPSPSSSPSPTDPPVLPDERGNDRRSTVS